MATKRFAIETVFKLIDRITAPMKRATRTTKRFSQGFKRDLRSAQVQVQLLATSIKTKLLGAIKLLATTGLFAIAAGIAIATREFLNFDQAITQAGVKFKDLKPGTVEYKNTLKELGATARKVGSETQFTATQAGEGLNFLAMAGFTSKQAMALLPKTVELATASSTDLALATDIASDSLGAFGLMSTNTAQLTKNLTRVNDVFAKTTTSTNTTLEQLFEGVAKGAPTFTDAGQSIETFSAAMGIMAQSGIKGGTAGTILRNSLLRVIATTGPASKEVKKLGIRVKDGNGNFRDYFDILKDANKATSKMGEVQRLASLDIIFGKRAVTGMSVVLKGLNTKTKDGKNQLASLRDVLLQSTGAAALMAKEMRKSLLNRLKILGSSLIEVGLKFVDAFAGKGGNAIDTMTKAVQAFDPKPISDGILFVIDVIGDLIDELKPFKEIIFGIVAAFAVYKVGLIAVAIAQGLVAATNPVTLIVLAIGVLVGSILWLIKNWEKVKIAFSDMWDFILDSLDIPLVRTLALVFMPFITIPILVIKHWDKVKAFFTLWFGILKFELLSAWQWFSNLLDNPFFVMAAVVLAPWLTIPALVVKHWERVKTFFIGLFNTVIEFVAKLWAKFSALLDNKFFTAAALILAPWITIPALIIKHWEKISEVISGVADKASKVAKEVVSFLQPKAPKGGPDILARALSTTPDVDEDDEDDEEISQTAAKMASQGIGAQAVFSQQKTISETTSKAEVTIRDKTGRATIDRQVPGVQLVASGVN